MQKNSAHKIDTDNIGIKLYLVKSQLLFNKAHARQMKKIEKTKLLLSLTKCLTILQLVHIHLNEKMI